MEGTAFSAIPRCGNVVSFLVLVLVLILKPKPHLLGLGPTDEPRAPCPLHRFLPSSKRELISINTQKKKKEGRGREGVFRIPGFPWVERGLVGKEGESWMERCSRGAPVLVVPGDFPAPGMSWSRVKLLPAPSCPAPEIIAALQQTRACCALLFVSTKEPPSGGVHTRQLGAPGGTGWGAGPGAPGGMGQRVLVGTTQPQ